jgi:hypothetical protein
MKHNAPAVAEEIDTLQGIQNLVACDQRSFGGFNHQFRAWIEFASPTHYDCFLCFRGRICAKELHQSKMQLTSTMDILDLHFYSRFAELVERCLDVSFYTSNWVQKFCAARTFIRHIELKPLVRTFWF